MPFQLVRLSARYYCLLLLLLLLNGVYELHLMFHSYTFVNNTVANDDDDDENDEDGDDERLNRQQHNNDFYSNTCETHVEHKSQRHTHTHTLILLCRESHDNEKNRTVSKHWQFFVDMKNG